MEMKKINERYFIKVEPMSFVLVEKFTSKTSGKTRYENIGYFGELKHLYNFLINLEIKDNLEMVDNIGKVQELIDGFIVHNFERK